MNIIKREFKELKLVLKAVPSLVIILFVMTIILMNLLANKSIALNIDWLALDCGIIISWLAFLLMDIIVKHFGPKVATEISILAILINLFFSLVLFSASIIPGIWAEGFNNDLVNEALNKTFGGTWYVILGSTMAFIVAAFINNFSNYGISKLFVKNPDGKLAYYTRTYFSTMLGQFVDNLLFSLIVSHIFFGWSYLQCLTCALTGMLVELFCEIIFAPLGYNIANKWRKNNIGEEYFNYLKEQVK